jgi:glycine cleavage system H protein
VNDIDIRTVSVIMKIVEPADAPVTIAGWRMNMSIPDQLYYTKEHLWIEKKQESCRAGLTHYAQELIGEISFIDPPAAGARIERGTKLLTIEGLKSVIDITAPYPLTVIAVNDELSKTPSLVNKSPYGDGWILEVSPPESGDENSLLSAAEYGSATGQ